MIKEKKNINIHFGTMRKFRVEKRRQARNALAAVDNLRFACLYTPAYNDILSAANHLKAAIDKMSIKRWGR